MYLKGHGLVQFNISKLVLETDKRKLIANRFTNIIKKNGKIRFIGYFLQQDAFKSDSMTP